MERRLGRAAAGAVALGFVSLSMGAALPQAAALHTDAGSYSFAGLQVPVGATSPSKTFIVSNAGRGSLKDITAATAGDFVITSNTCAAASLGAASPAGTAASSYCSVSVAFKPSARGMRSGGLTLSAAAVAPRTVTLDGGGPVAVPSTAVGTSSVRWVELPATAALSGSVTGPFAIALRTSYAYGAIAGITFAAATRTTGACAVPSGTPCSLYLGVEVLPSAPVGTSTGTVTLSNGLSYSVSADVLGPAVDVEPSMLDFGSIPVGSRSDTTAVILKNLSKSAFDVGSVSVTGPFTASSACPASLTAQASCVISVAFAPTAAGEATGFAQLSTAAGNVGIALTGSGTGNPADISLQPATLNLPLLASNNSGSRRITVTNLSLSEAATIGAPTGNICVGGNTQCIAFTGSTCTALAAGSSCQYILHYVGAVNEVTGTDTLTLPVKVGSTTTQYPIVVQHLTPTATAPSVMAFSTTDLRFPATPFRSASAAQTLTVKNLTSVPLSIAVSSIADFVADPTCVPLAPGASCDIAVHFVPTSGNTHAVGVLNVVAYDYSTTTNGAVLGNAGLTVSGSSISTAALASPAAPPLVQPVSAAAGFAITNSSSVALIIDGVYSDTYGGAFDASACPVSLAPGATCYVYQSAPCGAPPSPCHLNIASNSASSPDIYSIAGNQDLQPDDLSVGPQGPSVFAATPVGSASSADAINVELFEYMVDSPFSVPFNVYLNTTPDFAVSNGCPTVLNPVADRDFYIVTCTISVQFTPQSSGFKTGTITYASGQDTQTILLAGTAPGAGLMLSPANLFLGAFAGQTATQTVTVTNASSAAIGFTSFAIAGAGAASFSIGSTSCGTRIAAGANCTIAVIYSTPSTYLATANLVVTLTSGLVQTVGLQGVIPSIIEYGTTSGSFPFGEITVGKTAQTSVIFGSYDGYPITVTGLTLTGPNAASYAIVSNTCIGTLLQGTSGGAGTCTVNLVFAPQAVGKLPETLQFRSSIGKTDFDITGSGGPIAASVSPSTLDFGSQAIGTPSAPLTITLNNPNSVALTVRGAGNLSGTNVGDFAVSGSCAQIPANGSCSYTVVFTPSGLGARNAALPIYAGDVTYSQSQPTATVGLVGGGIANGTPGVDLSAAYDVDGIGVDGSHTRAGGLDGLGDSYSGTLLGPSVYWSGSFFTFGNAGVADAISGSTVPLPAGNFAALKLLATAVRSNRPNQVFTVNYTDGTSTSSERSLSSWTTPQQYLGETVAATMAYRLNPDGTHHSGTYYVYGYSLSLDNTKTVKSVTLPTDRNVVVLAMDLAVTNQTPVDLSKVANVSAVHTDGVVAVGAGIDELGDAYSAQRLGTSLTWAGATFNLPEALPLDALANTTLALPTGFFSKLNVLATAVRGNQLSHSFTVTYTDGTTATFKQSFSDWHSPQGYAGETNVRSVPYRLNGDGSQHAGTYWVYGYSFPLDTTKTVKSVALPGVRTVVVLAVTLSP